MQALRRVYMTQSRFIAGMMMRALIVGEHGVKSLTLHTNSGVIDVEFEQARNVSIGPSVWEMAEHA